MTITTKGAARMLHVLHTVLILLLSKSSGDEQNKYQGKAGDSQRETKVIPFSSDSVQRLSFIFTFPILLCQTTVEETASTQTQTTGSLALHCIKVPGQPLLGAALGVFHMQIHSSSTTSTTTALGMECVVEEEALNLVC